MSHFRSFNLATIAYDDGNLWLSAATRWCAVNCEKEREGGGGLGVKGVVAWRSFAFWKLKDCAHRPRVGGNRAGFCSLSQGRRHDMIRSNATCGRDTLEHGTGYVNYLWGEPGLRQHAKFETCLQRWTHLQTVYLVSCVKVRPVS